MFFSRTPEWDRDALSQAIHDKTWAGELWGPGGAIKLAERRFRLDLVAVQGDRRKLAAAYSSISSTYHTAAGNAYARFKRAPIRAKAFWVFRAWRYRRRSLEVSNEVEALLGLDGMTPTQLDVRSSILLGVGNWEHALDCIEKALSWPDVPAESRLLLLVGRAKCLDHDDRRVAARAALSKAERLLPEVRIQTQVRFHKAYGEHYERSGRYYLARQSYKTAIELAREHGLSDQEEKILVGLARLPSLS